MESIRSPCQQSVWKTGEHRGFALIRSGKQPEDSNIGWLDVSPSAVRLQSLIYWTQLKKDLPHICCHCRIAHRVAQPESCGFIELLSDPIIKWHVGDTAAETQATSHREAL